MGASGYSFTDRGVRPVIVRFDMLKVARILESGDLPVQLAEPQVDGRVAVAYRTDVALEVPDVYGVEADDRDEESNVGLGQLVTDEVILALEHLLKPI